MIRMLPSFLYAADAATLTPEMIFGVLSEANVLVRDP